VTDTDDTDDEHQTGSYNYYSHGAYALTHQHWVRQVISAGGFNVHDVQGPEASHKFNMHLASLRVKHMENNGTQDSMLRFMCYHTVFEELKYVMPATMRPPRKERSLKPGLYMHLNFHNNLGGPGAIGDKFLHPKLRLTEKEIANLICTRKGLPLNDASYLQIRTVQLLFGQKFVREDGRVFWATELRRDIFRMGGHDKHGNALCCEAVCFLTIDAVAYALIRWFQPHPDS